MLINDYEYVFSYSVWQRTKNQEANIMQVPT